MRQIPAKTLKNILAKKEKTILIRKLEISDNHQYIDKEADKALDTQDSKADYHKDPEAILIKITFQE